jgi:hypothetical protein
MNCHPTIAEEHPLLEFPTTVHDFYVISTFVEFLISFEITAVLDTHSNQDIRASCTGCHFLHGKRDEGHLVSRLQRGSCRMIVPNINPRGLCAVCTLVKAWALGPPPRSMLLNVSCKGQLTSWPQKNVQTQAEERHLRPKEAARR